MSRISMTSVACWLACASLLAACDKASKPAAAVATVAPQPKATPAAQSPAAESVQLGKQEPAATAQIMGANAEVLQVVAPHMAQEGEEGLTVLKALEGKYRWDGVDYLKTGVLAQRLKALTGAQYETVLQNLDTVGPLATEGNVLAVFGNRRHMGGEESAAIVIDPVRNGLRVWLLSEGRQTVFTDVKGAEIPWTESVQSLIDNVQQSSAS